VKETAATVLPAETPKDETLDLDRRNLATLRRLAATHIPSGAEREPRVAFGRMN
jgi:hypothetical protein